MFGLGAGRGQPALHAEAYDFPDSLLKPGVAVMAAVARRALLSP
jgi:metal-dependent amidase/aminoacylase/carboxypeptidase family protein